MSRVYTQINLKKIAKDYFDRGYTPEGIDHDMDPHCETMEELNEWAKKHGYMNYIFELNFVRIMSKKSQKMANRAGRPKLFQKEFSDYEL